MWIATMLAVLAMVASFFTLVLVVLAAYGPARKPRIVGGKSERFQALTRAVPLLWSCPRGPLDFSSTLQLLVFGIHSALQEARFEKDYDFDVEDIQVTLPGESAEKCADRVRIMWLRGAKGDAPRQLPDDAPIVILCPGLNCYTASLPGTSMYRAMLERPWRVCAFEKRGVGPVHARGLQAPAFHLFGHPSDFHAAVLRIKARYPDAPLHIIGVSSGNGLTGSYAAMYGGEVDTLRSVLLLIGGEDYNVAFKPPTSNWLTRLLFDVVLLATTKQRFLRRNEKLLRTKDSAAYDAAANASTLQEFYDISMQHFSGYQDSAEAERRINRFSGGNECMKTMRIPFLYVGTEDDPVAPGGPRPEWMTVAETCENSAVALFPCGSHLACYDSWRFTRWADKLVLQWVDAFES